MPRLTCPRCTSENVKPIQVWRNASANLKINEPPPGHVGLPESNLSVPMAKRFIKTDWERT